MLCDCTAAQFNFHMIYYKMNKKILVLAITILTSVGISTQKANAQEVIQKVNTSIFPSPQKGYKRMVIEVPYSKSDKNKRIEFSVGKMMEVDGCNYFGLQGTLEKKDLTGWGYEYYEFSTKGEVISTQMGCPTMPKRNLFVSNQPTMVNYNGKMPIVIYVPEEYDVQFKIYKADDEIYQASEDLIKKQ